MDAKEYLSQAIWLDRRIQTKIEEKERIREMAEKVNGCLSHTKVSGSREHQQIVNTLVKLIDLEWEIVRMIDRLVDLKREIGKMIQEVEDTNQQMVLELRYLCGKGWDEIACEMRYDPRTIFRLHGKGLGFIEKKMGTKKSCQ
ncbi:MAG: DUF1492 domain-containing protein [Bacillota bacterium]|nr:DUF1492 domain-containing protein [Bacillota bacterium]MDW7677836.1 DUF1492 domain-containing protein [Bacillota bacterium]